MAAATAAGPATAADLTPCRPGTAPGVRLTPEPAGHVVFGRSVTVGAAVQDGVTGPRLELRTAAGTLLAVTTAVAPGPGVGTMRIPGLPAPRGGTRSLTARVTGTAQVAGAACGVADERIIRLVPGRLGRLRIDPRPSGSEITIRTAAGEGCQDYLRSSTVRVQLTDVTGARPVTEVLESVHPCDGWTIRGGGRSSRIEVEPQDANLVLCAPGAAATGRFRLTVTRSGALVARGTIVVAADRVTFVRDAPRGR